MAPGDALGALSPGVSPADHGAGVAFKVLHVKGGGAAIEPSAEFSASHVKWVVSSLSPVGPLIQSREPLQYHGAVILYKAIDEHPSLSFWVFVAANNSSVIKVAGSWAGGSSQAWQGGRVGTGVGSYTSFISEELLRRATRDSTLVESGRKQGWSGLRIFPSSGMQVSIQVSKKGTSPGGLESDRITWKGISMGSASCKDLAGDPHPGA